ncbi:MAG TPA: O-antigen ligase family protein [Candidatus Binatia bacterium]|nr:O-antigen ligase family protein [Candidatus Binatia bacterium]
MTTATLSRGPGRLALGAVLIGVAAGFACLPREAAVVAALAWGMTLLWFLPREMNVMLPLLLLLSVPADYIAGLDGPAHGFFVLGATLTLCLAAGLRSGFASPSLDDWDLYALIAVLCGATLLHASNGELRGVLFWIGAGLFLWWLRAEERGASDVRGQVVHALLFAGALGGLIAIIDRAHLFDAARLIPGYEPHELEFSLESGSRAAALSGHPLRFGSLAMLSSIFALAYATDEQVVGGRKRLYVGLLFLSLAGLVLSGARGSWLGAAIALVSFLLLRFRSGSWRAAERVLVYVAGAAILVWASGLFRLIQSRLFGAAFHPGSINQRVLVVEGIRYVWTQVPLFGVGFGGAAEMGMRMGLRLLNLENEYLRFFFTAGFAGPIALLLVGIRRMRAAASRLSSAPVRTGTLCALPAILVNVGTYNLFSWSMGPPLLAALAFLAMPTTSSGANHAAMARSSH